MSTSASPANILERILARKRDEVALSKPNADRQQWADRAHSAAAPPSFLDAIGSAHRMAIIAEIKRASPSAGVLRQDFDPIEIARIYQAHGADCLSILTDVDFFQGSIEHLAAVSRSSTLPILRKDFVIDPVQVFEAKLAGASACLLIAECLGAQELGRLVELIESLGMTALVELHEPARLFTVLDSGARLIGINNRDLKSFQTDLRVTLDLAPRIPRDRWIVSESGIKTREDMLRLEEAGVRAILVGESLLRAPDPGSKLSELRLS